MTEPLTYNVTTMKEKCPCGFSWEQIYHEGKLVVIRCAGPDMHQPIDWLQDQGHDGKAQEA